MILCISRLTSVGTGRVFAGTCKGASLPSLTCADPLATAIAVQASAWTSVRYMHNFVSSVRLLSLRLSNLVLGQLTASALHSIFAPLCARRSMRPCSIESRAVPCSSGVGPEGNLRYFARSTQ
jgi:hypothetical protein